MAPPSRSGSRRSCQGWRGSEAAPDPADCVRNVCCATLGLIKDWTIFDDSPRIRRTRAGCRGVPAHGRAPDGRRHCRGDRRPADPGRRPLAGRLRLLQLPRARPRPRGDRPGACLPGPLGDPSQLGQGDRQPGALPAGRDGGQRAARGRGRPRLPHPDPYPQRRAPGARRRGDGPGRPARPPDHPRRRRHGRRPGGDRAAVPRRRRRARPAAAPGRGQGPAPGLHGRGQLDDRQPARSAGLRRPGPRARRPAVRGRRPRLRGRRPARRLRPDPPRPPRQLDRALVG